MWLPLGGDAGEPEGARGIFAGPFFLSGFAWAENVGWINMGDGTPADGVAYANLNGTDFGVNVNPATGALSGYAWGENIGWINFGDGTPANGVNYANVNGTDAGVNHNAANGLLSGFAWSENAGWLNLAMGAGLESNCRGSSVSTDGIRRCFIDCGFILPISNSQSFLISGMLGS